MAFPLWRAFRQHQNEKMNILYNTTTLLLTETLACIPKAASTWFLTATFPLIAKSGNNLSVQAKCGWINYIKSILCNKLQWWKSVWCIDTDRKDAITDRKRKIQKSIYNRILYMLKKIHSKTIFSKCIYINAKKSERHSIWQSEIMRCPFLLSSRIFLEILYKIFHKIFKTQTYSISLSVSYTHTHTNTHKWKCSDMRNQEGCF